MTVALVSFAGHNIQSSTYASWLEVPDLPYSREAELRTVQPIGGWARFVRHDERERVVVVHLEVKSSFVTNGEVLARWFRPGASGALVASFSGTNRALDCVVRRIVPYDGSANRFTAVLVAPDPRWRSATLTQDVEAVTASGQTWSITNSGNATEDAPVFRIKPTSLKDASDDWRYQREVVVANRVDRPLSDWALELTEEWDHAAEVTAGRSLSSGNDVRVLVDGVEVPRWDGGGTDSAWNKTKTKIWINLSFSPGLQAELLSTITDSAPANDGDLPVVRNSHQEYPESGWLLLGDEVIRYSGKSATAFTGITRGARGTTAAAATAGATIWWVEHRVQVMYGYTGASAPEARDERRPMIDLDASTNTSHKWNDFAHDTDPRSMQWGRSLVSRDGQHAKILAAGGSPLASMVLEYQSAGAKAGKPNFNAFSRPVPTGTASGGTLSMTRAVADTLAFKTFGRDEDGNEVTLEEENGAQASGTNNVTLPAAPVFSVEFYARSQVIDGSPETGTAATTALANSEDNTAQSFDAPASGSLDSVLVRIVNASGSGVTLNWKICGDDGSGAPSANAIVSSGATVPGSFDGWWDILMTPFDLVAGETYWIELWGNGNLSWRVLRNVYNGDFLDSGTLQNSTVARFRLTSKEVDEFGQFAAADDGDQVTIDGVTVPLDSAHVPYVAFGAQADAYWLDGKLTNNQTAQSVTLALLCSVDDEIEIDVGARTVRNLTADESVLYGATFSDEDAWIEIAGGDSAQANELQYDEPDLVGVTVDTDLRSRWL